MQIGTTFSMPDIEALFHLYSRECYWMAFAFCGDRTLSEDAVQETFLVICEEPERLKGVTNMRSYLLRMTKNYLIDHFRKRQVEQKHEPLIADEIEVLNEIEEILHYSSEEYQEMLVKAKRLLESLPEGCRKIFIMATIEGLSYNMIAEQEGISVNTVKTQLRIARKRLKGHTVIVLLFLSGMLK